MKIESTQQIQAIDAWLENIVEQINQETNGYN